MFKKLVRGTAGIPAKWDTMQSFVKMLAIMPTLWLFFRLNSLS
jgi:hypothetical protein